MKLISYSYHELMNRWTGEEYVPRPFDGQFSLIDIIEKIEVDYESKPLSLFIKPYLLFSWSNEDADMVANRLKGVLAVKCFNHHNGQQVPHTTEPQPFYPDMEGDISEMLDTARTEDDFPYLSHVEFWIV
jgi:hypothetical protein